MEVTVSGVSTLLIFMNGCMVCFDISLCVVAAFLVLTLLVGVYFSRKQTTFREYAVGNKQFATTTLVFTVLATLYGGRRVGT